MDINDRFVTAAAVDVNRVVVRVVACLVVFVVACLVVFVVLALVRVVAFAEKNLISAFVFKRPQIF
jgi:hypothetical protein